jgi:nucleotide-binding universal stress UspA family protein
MVDRVATVPQTTLSALPESNTLDRILLAVDGSPASDAVVRTVGTLVRSHNGEVFVVHISADGPLVSSFFSPDAMTLRWGTTLEAQAHVDDAVRTLDSLGVHATGRVYSQVERVGRELVDTSRSLRCGLVAVGSGRRGRLGAALLGSVSRLVIHQADGSVLVASSSCIVSSSFGRILVAVDGSTHAQQAVHVAANVADAVGAEVVVLHVCDPRGAPWVHYELDGFGHEMDAASTADSLVDRMAGVLTARGLTALPTVRAVTGGVASDILRAATSFDCQLVVVGNHSRGRPGSMLGGVASKLLRSATVPVLVAR